MTNVIITAGQSNMANQEAYINDLFAQAVEDWVMVNCAVGGTSILEWQPGTTLYQSMLDGFAAVEQPNFSALLFFQGEKDAKDCDVAVLWRQKFRAMVNALRTDLGGDGHVIYAQLGPNPNPGANPCWAEVQNQQQSAKINQTNYWMIKTDDLGNPYCGGPHFCDEDYHTIAQRFKNRTYISFGL